MKDADQLRHALEQRLEVGPLVCPRCSATVDDVGWACPHCQSAVHAGCRAAAACCPAADPEAFAPIALVRRRGALLEGLTTLAIWALVGAVVAASVYGAPARLIQPKNEFGSCLCTVS